MEVILNFHSTCVMNFATHDYAVSLFPFPSLVSRASLVNANNEDDASIALKKYMDPGWEMLKVPGYTDFLSCKSEDEFYYIWPLTACGSSHSFDDIQEGLTVNCWSVSIASEGRSSIYFELGEVDGWKRCCVARQIMVSGLIDKTRFAGYRRGCSSKVTETVQ
ncbi:hypothetical protein K435DRAFT_874598 [Dendrothele bispora CBS 962.96]|uniref:Uncharacterized protein n=1 Tax=Dendrothele bispora (strain CBS 962.96) TaxID=1314807 RepID=A0A4S8KW82_DENBC|nr:hypothetical protein K435DRAFT_874598 [Dendrothele bispora CBS 962.96]